MDHSVNVDSCTVFHFGPRPITVDVPVAGLILYGPGSGYMVSLGRSTYTLPICIRTQCPVWRSQGVAGLEGVSGITRLV